MKMYRIFTEQKIGTLEAVEAAMSEAGFDGFTVLLGRGFWKGKMEISCIVEVLAPGTVEVMAAIGDVARRLKKMLQQEAVLVQTVECEEALY